MSEFEDFLFFFHPKPVYKLHCDWMRPSSRILFNGLWREETGDTSWPGLSNTNEGSSIPSSALFSRLTERT